MDTNPQNGKKPSMFRSLSAKLIITFVPLVCASIMALFAILEYRSYRTQQSELQDNLNRFVAVQSTTFAKLLWDFDVNTLESLLSHLENDPDLQSIAVFDTSDQLVAGTALIKDAPQSPDLRITQRLIYTTSDVTEFVGKIVVTFQTNRINRQLTERLFTDAMILMVLFTILVFVTLFVTRVMIGRPLARLNSSIERARAEHVREPVQWEANDEIGDVVRSYNEMQEKQFTAEKELEAYRDQLEDLVEQRTEELNQKTAVLQAVLSSMTQGIVAFDKDLKLIAWNDQYLNIREYPAEMARDGADFEDFIRHDVDRQEFGPGDPEKIFQEMVAIARKFEAHEFERQRPNGRFIEVRGGPLPGGGFVSTYTDITERKTAEEALEKARKESAEAEALLTDAIENMSEGFVVFDAADSLVICNERYREMLPGIAEYIRPGVTFKELAQRAFESGRYEGSGDAEEARDRILEMHSSATGEPYIRKNESGRWVQSIEHRTSSGGTVGIRTDITNIKKAEEEIIAQSATLDTTLQSMDQGIVLVDGDLKALAYNDKFIKLFDLADDFFQSGRDFEDFIRYLYEKIVLDDTKKEIALGNLGQRTFQVYEITFPDGRFIEVRHNPLKGGGFVRTYSDMTEWKRNEVELTVAKTQAESATRAKAAFLATMSHEIRTPMNGIIGMIDLLAETKLGDDQRQMMTTVRESAFSLLTIINDILDFSKIEAGKLELESIPMSIRDLVEGVGETLAPNARKKGLSLYTYVDPKIPDAVFGDQVRLRQILFNLGGNAVKFTSEGSIWIKAEALPTEDDVTASVRVRIIDTGIGIPKQAQEDLFKPFTQAESSTSRRFGGTGLGLSISLRLADMMGGEITVDSVEGEGSSFSLTVSYPITEEGSHTFKSDGYDLSGLRVLFALKLKETQDILSSYVGHWGAQTKTVFDIAELEHAAMQAAAEGNKFDVVVIASAWSRQEQEAVCAAIRKQPQLDNLRFVLMSLVRIKPSDKYTKDITFVTGAPLRRANFIRAVAVAAGRASPEIEVDESVLKENTGRLPTVSEAEAEGRLILLAEDNKTNQDVIKRQINLLGYAVEIVDNGQLALDALNQKTYGVLLTDCHMPVLDGYELAEKVREKEKDDFTRIPIVAITASVMKDEVDRCYQAGMDDFLSKPVEMQKLKEALRKWLPAAARGSADTPPPPTAGDSPDAAEEVLADEPLAASESETAVDTGDAIDPQALKSVFGDDDETFREILKDYVEPATANVKELEDAFAGQSAAGVGAAAHKMKSSSRAIGANALADLCSNLEKAGKSEDWEVLKVDMPRLPGLFEAVVKYIEAL